MASSARPVHDQDITEFVVGDGRVRSQGERHAEKTDREVLLPRHRTGHRRAHDWPRNRWGAAAATRHRNGRGSPPASCSCSPMARRRVSGCPLTGAASVNSISFIRSSQTAASRARSRQGSGSASRATFSNQARRRGSAVQLAQSSSAATMALQASE